MAPLRFIAAALRRLRKPASSEAGHIRLGREGENHAVRHLRKIGYKILRRNFRAPHGGEVDIVCRHGNELVFVEVKTRSSENFGRPFEAVDRKKRQLIIRGAMKWLRLLGMPDVTFRFDVVEVVTCPAIDIQVLENAFQLPDNYSY
jgi:putative endonuclease